MRFSIVSTTQEKNHGWVFFGITPNSVGSRNVMLFTDYISMKQFSRQKKYCVCRDDCFIAFN